MPGSAQDVYLANRHSTRVNAMGIGASFEHDRSSERVYSYQGTGAQLSSKERKRHEVLSRASNRQSQS